MGCAETFMHKSANCQHPRDSTNTVPYVPANPVGARGLAAASQFASLTQPDACVAGYTNGEWEKKTILLSNS